MTILKKYEQEVDRYFKLFVSVLDGWNQLLVPFQKSASNDIPFVWLGTAERVVDTHARNIDSLKKEWISLQEKYELIPPSLRRKEALKVIKIHRSEIQRVINQASSYAQGLLDQFNKHAVSQKMELEDDERAQELLIKLDTIKNMTFGKFAKRMVTYS